MSVSYIYPVSDDSPNDFDPLTGSDNYAMVDDPQGSADDDTTYVTKASGAWDPTTFKQHIKLGSNYDVSTASTLTSGYQDFTKSHSRPGGGSWTKQDIKDLSFGVRYTDADTEEPQTIYDYYGTNDSAVESAIGSDDIDSVETVARARWFSATKKYGRVTQVYLKITHSAGAGPHPAPTDGEVDRVASASQNNACEDPCFTAVWQATGGSGTAVDYDIDVSPNSDYSSPVWASGWTALASSIDDNERCEELSYNGTTLSSAPNATNKYYWRIRFRDASEVASAYFEGTFGGINRDWPAAVAGYALRKKLLWLEDHDAIAAGYDQAFNLETGTRRVLATNGTFDEGIQDSGFKTVTANGRRHIVFQGNPVDPTDSAELGIWIVTEDLATGETGTPYYIMSAVTTFDSHNNPNITVGSDGRLHVFFAEHSGAGLYYARSVVAGVSGSLSGDPASGNWEHPTGGTKKISEAGICTYPHPFTIEGSVDTGRIYVFFRIDGLPRSNQNGFIYSDNHGATWAGKFIHINDTYYVDADNEAQNVYCYGFRYDRNTGRLHIAWTHQHETGGVLGDERGLWYGYSDYDDQTGGGVDVLDVGYNVFRKASGAVIGVTNTSALSGAEDPIDFVAANAIVLSYHSTAEPNRHATIFMTRMTLDKYGKPVLFYEQNYKGAEPTWETDLWLARYDSDVGGSGSWIRKSVSIDVNLKQRVRRSALGIMTDRDGTLRGLMPVGGLTYHRKLPTQGVDNTGVTKSSYDYKLSALAEACGHWRFTAGSLADSSGNGNTLTNNKSVPFIAGYTETGNTVADIANASSSGDELIRAAPADNSDFRFTSSQSFTVEAIFRTTSTSYFALADCGDWPDDGGWKFTVSQFTAGELGFLLNDEVDGTGNEVSGDVDGVTVNDGQWHYAALVIDRSTDIAHIYLDGKLISGAGFDISDVTGNMPGTTTTDFWAGDELDGELDELAISAKALSYDEIIERAGRLPGGNVTTWAEVDDYPGDFVSGDSYLDLTATTGKASFASNFSDPAGVDAIIDVEVLAFVAEKSGATSCKLYISDGATDDVGSSNAVSGTAPYDLVSEIWDENPFTASAWVLADLEDLEFGVQNDHASTDIRVGQIYLRIHVRRSSDEKRFAAEPWLLNSSDGGRTWSAEETSRNSSIGVPIVSDKHHLTNDQVDFVYGSGHNLFRHTDLPYGLAQLGGNDVRIFYAGAEIDRVADYFNLVNSEIRFKVQAAIAADRRAGANDYYVYIGAPGVTSNPQSDPDDIFTDVETWETFDKDENINGKNGWTVATGTGTIYESPPEHANKRANGGKAVEFAGAFEAWKTVGSGLTNVWVEAHAWLEGSGKIWIEVEDGSSNEFRVGLDTSGGAKAGYAINGGTWVATDYLAASQRQIKIAIHVTANGCSAYYEGNCIKREIPSTLTSVNKIRIHADDEGTFDEIFVGSRLKKTAETEIAQGSLDDATAQYHAGATPVYSGVDAKHSFPTSADRITKLDLDIETQNSLGSGTENHTHRLYISGSSPYDSDDIIEYEDKVIQTTDTGTTETTWTMRDLPEGVKSWKLQIYSSDAGDTDGIGSVVVESSYFNETLEPTIDVQDEEIRGFIMGLTIQGIGGDIFTNQITIGGYRIKRTGTIGLEAAYRAVLAGALPAELLLHTEGRGNLALENKTPLVVSASMPIEISQLIRLATAFPQEVLRKAASAGDLALEFNSHLEAAGSIVLGFLSSSQAAGSIPIESLITAERARANFALETAARPSLAANLPEEYLGQVRVEVPGLLPIEILAAIKSRATVPVAHLSGLVANMRTAIEISAGALSAAKLALENKAPLIALGSMAVEFLKLMEPAFTAFPQEFGEHKRSSANLALEMAARPHLVGNLPEEYLGQLRVEASGLIALETLAGLVAWSTMPIESGSRKQIGSKMALEVLAHAASRGANPLEFKSRKAIGAELALELLTRFETWTALPVESGSRKQIGSRFSLEILAATLSAAALPLEYTGGLHVTAPGLLALEVLQAAESRARLAQEYKQFTRSGTSFPIEELLQVKVSGSIPQERLGLVKAAGRLVLAYLASIGVRANLAIENNIAVGMIARLSLEIQAGLKVSAIIPIETLYRNLLAAKMPLEWGGIILTGILIDALRLEFPELRDLELEAPQFDGLALELAQLINLDLETPDIINLRFEPGDIKDLEI